jgi:DNA-binding winged helix-turn-helix (wHTH) protein
MIYHFEQFELDMGCFELRQEGAVRPLEPQVFALLAYLVEHRERLVPKNELFEKLWSGRVVTDSALTSRIKSARQVLGDSGKAQQFIKTIHGKGFRFVADVWFADGLTHELIIELTRTLNPPANLHAFSMFELATERRNSFVNAALRHAS